MSPLPPITTIFIFLPMRLLLGVLVFILVFGLFVIRSLRTFGFAARRLSQQEQARLRVWPDRWQSYLIRCCLSGLDERKQVGVDRVGLSCGHAVRKTLVGFQRAISQQLCGQRRRIGIRHNLV